MVCADALADTRNAPTHQHQCRMRIGLSKPTKKGMQHNATKGRQASIA